MLAPPWLTKRVCTGACSSTSKSCRALPPLPESLASLIGSPDSPNHLLSQDGAEIDFKRIGRAFCQIQRQLVGCAAKALPCQYPPVGDSLAKTNNTVACTTANPQQTLLLALQ